MLHIYRQVMALQRVETFVMTNKIEEAERFPFDDIEQIPLPPFNPVRHGWLKLVRAQPALVYRGEYQVLVSMLKRRGADLMHIYFGHTGVHLLPFVRTWGRPCVVSFHGADVALNKQVADYAGKSRQLFDAVGAVLARSESIAARLRELGCPPEKIRLNRTGIPLEKFPFVKRQLPADGAWRILQACRLIEKKGVASTLIAFAKFVEKFPRAKLSIAGKGPMRRELGLLAQRLGIASKVTFHGFLNQPDLETLYTWSHIFIHPSEMTLDLNQEGVPNSLLEAMATGMPAVATRHGGIPEAIADGGNGFLCEERDANALASALLEIASSRDLYWRFSGAAREAVAERFDQQRTIRELEQVYLDLAARHGEQARNRELSLGLPQTALEMP